MDITIRIKYVMKAVIDKRVINDMEKIIDLAKKKRKVLKKKDINELKSIDAIEVWNLLNHYTLKLRTEHVPSDILRMIFRYLPAEEYYRIASSLNHKFRDWVHKDVTIIKFSIDYRDKGYKIYYPDKISYPLVFNFYEKARHSYYERRYFYCKNGSKEKNRQSFKLEMKLSGKLDTDSWKLLYRDNEMILRKYITGLEYVTKKVPEIELESFWKNSKGKILDKFSSPKNSLYDHVRVMILSPITEKDDLFMYVNAEIIDYDRRKIVGW